MSDQQVEPTVLKEEDISINKEIEDKLEQLSVQETQEMLKSFQQHFDDCTKACKKPNILLAGITGAGKSSLINAVFGENVANAGAGMPVTQQFFEKF
jgi:predicted GTPase